MHALTIKLLGYRKAVHTVLIQDNVTATVEILLDASATPLDQVVVTGTVILTELKAVPNAMTVITAKQIEERGITKIDQLFRGDVPGVVAVETGGGAGNAYGQVQMFSRGVSSLGTGFSGGNTLATSVVPAMKTYVDGVELRDPTFLNTIDPRSIDHIEIIPGPEASTIYGSGALMGVMQVFTKHGLSSARPRIMVAATYGMIQNNLSSQLAPQHEDALQVDGGEGPTNYTAGGTYRYSGRWTPGQVEQSVSGYGSVRHVAGLATATASFRSVTRTLRSAVSGLQGVTADNSNGLYTVDPHNFLPQSINFNTPQQTIGFTLDVHPAVWWTQSLVLGQDASSDNQIARTPTYADPSDTLLIFQQEKGQRTSETYNTTVRTSLGEAFSTTVVAGMDHWHDGFDGAVVNTRSLVGNLTGSPALSRADQWNTGEYAQLQLGLHESVFLTAGIRAEQSNAYGKEIGTTCFPRYGISMVHDFAGQLTVKLRGAYGVATRPPVITEKLGVPFYGYAQFGVPIFYFNLPNALLGPEQQEGREGGIELYWGNRGSLSVTRYDQHVDDLITSVGAIDSVRVPLFNIYLTEPAFVNIGRVRNDGWEGVATIAWGPWRAKGSLSMARSRVVRVADPSVGSPSVQAQLKAQYPIGSQLPGGIEHTGGASLVYASGPTTATLAISAIGSSIRRFNSQAWIDYTYGRLVDQAGARATAPSNNNWYTVSRPYATADLLATRTLTSVVSVTLRVTNLMNAYHNDYFIIYPTQGRTTQLGLRARW